MGSSGEGAAGVEVGAGVVLVLASMADALASWEAAGRDPAHPESAPRTARTTADAASPCLDVDVCVFTMYPR